MKQITTCQEVIRGNAITSDAYSRGAAGCPGCRQQPSFMSQKAGTIEQTKPELAEGSEKIIANDPQNRQQKNTRISEPKRQFFKEIKKFGKPYRNQAKTRRYK